MSGISGKARIWFAALLRSAVALVLTLVVLALLGGVTDVVLHTTRHTSSYSQSFNGVRAVEVVLDGDISLTVLGRTGDQHSATLNAVDTSTPFDDPVRTTNVIAGTLYLTEHCPDSRCTAQLTLMLDAKTQVDVVSGNALRMDQAVIDFNGISGRATVQAAPAKLIVTDTVVTGAVIGMIECDTIQDCAGVATSAAGAPAR
ncbi:MAG TPA: hypothetical protein VFN97_08800 [Actinospica sp.]|nr:hypothetical protein [Actinospica sp.]